MQRSDPALASDDFHFLYRQGTLISRVRPEAQPINNPGLLAHDQAQVRELLTKYGPIDMFWIDGPPESLREVAWDTDPNVLITRGAMETPEQTIPGQPLDGPWEACFTMGNQWQYKPTNEDYKSGTQLINMLIETRAKGGNRWPHGAWQTVTLTSLRATENTRVSVLGQNDQVLEYQPHVIPKTTWKQTADGLEITAMRTQRLYNDRQWPNPVVLKIENVEAVPPS